ncbi:MAG: hypothetical protein ABH879_03545 [archaeon]
MEHLTELEFAFLKSLALNDDLTSGGWLRTKQILKQGIFKSQQNNVPKARKPLIKKKLVDRRKIPDYIDKKNRPWSPYEYRIPRNVSTYKKIHLIFWDRGDRSFFGSGYYKDSQAQLNHLLARFVRSIFCNESVQEGYITPNEMLRWNEIKALIYTSELFAEYLRDSISVKRIYRGLYEHLDTIPSLDENVRIDLILNSINLSSFANTYSYLMTIDKKLDETTYKQISLLNQYAANELKGRLERNARSRKLTDTMLWESLENIRTNLVHRGFSEKEILILLKTKPEASSKKLSLLPSSQTP